MNVGNLFVADGNAELSATRLCRMQRIRKCLLSKPLTLLAVLVLLW
jgi:hypothetical protein